MPFFGTLLASCYIFCISYHLGFRFPFMFFSVGWANGEAFRAGSQNGVYRFLASVMVACLFLRVESDGGGRWTVSESVSAAEEKCAR